MTDITSEIGEGSEDEASILRILASRERQVVHTSPDIDWENAFGVRRNGSVEVQEFLTKRVEPTLVKAERSVLENRIRLITSEVAVADTYWRLTGQTKGPGGPEVPERRGRTTYVLRKESGKWMIVMQRVADLRDSL